MGFIYREVFEAHFDFSDKAGALKFFQALRQLFRGWNSAEWNSDEFGAIEKEIRSVLTASRAGSKEKIHA
jgi:hypothetical protein